MTAPMSHEESVTWLRGVLSRIADGELLPAPYFASLDRDAALDARDADPEFEGEWLRIQDEIDRLRSVTAVPNEVASLIEDVRRESFLAVSRATRQHEIAGTVSDDFDLMAQGRTLGIDAPFLDRLWRTYSSGGFPSPPF